MIGSRANRRNDESTLYWVLIVAIGVAGIGYAIYSEITAAPPPPAKVVEGRAWIIDGDTIVIDGAHIRLAYIDAPELGQSCKDGAGATYACGQVAKDALRRAIAGRTVRCEQVATDRYGRIVAVCASHGRDLGDAMVRGGQAINYGRFDSDDRYSQAENEARAASRGIWQGTFEQPEEWRRRQ
jgi:endonuclease YncB( thermonuclease family)